MVTSAKHIPATPSTVSNNWPWNPGVIVMKRCWKKTQLISSSDIWRRITRPTDLGPRFVSYCCRSPVLHNLNNRVALMVDPEDVAHGQTLINRQNIGSYPGHFVYKVTPCVCINFAVVICWSRSNLYITSWEKTHPLSNSAEWVGSPSGPLYCPNGWTSEMCRNSVLKWSFCLAV